MKHTTTVEVVTKVMTIEAREVHQGDMLLEVNKDFTVVPWYIRDAEFEWADDARWRMVKMTVNNSNEDDEPETRRFRDSQKVTVVRVR